MALCVSSCSHSENPKEEKAKLLLTIDEEGRVEEVKVVQSTSKKVAEKAVEIAKGSLYEPPLRGGRPVKADFYKVYRLLPPGSQSDRSL